MIQLSKFIFNQDTQDLLYGAFICYILFLTVLCIVLAIVLYATFKPKLKTANSNVVRHKAKFLNADKPNKRKKVTDFRVLRISDRNHLPAPSENTKFKQKTFVVTDINNRNGSTLGMYFPKCQTNLSSKESHKWEISLVNKSLKVLVTVPGWGQFMGLVSWKSTIIVNADYSQATLLHNPIIYRDLTKTHLVCSDNKLVLERGPIGSEIFPYNVTNMMTNVKAHDTFVIVEHDASHLNELLDLNKIEL